jgi:hypothetical protein
VSAAGFYTTVIREPRKVGYLLGPFPDEPTARAAIPAARRLAEAVDPRTVFDAFGTCRLELTAGPLPRGVLMDRYEKELVE